MVNFLACIYIYTHLPFFQSVQFICLPFLSTLPCHLVFFLLLKLIFFFFFLPFLFFLLFFFVLFVYTGLHFRIVKMKFHVSNLQEKKNSVILNVRQGFVQMFYPQISNSSFISREQISSPFCCSLVLSELQDSPTLMTLELPKLDNLFFRILLNLEILLTSSLFLLLFFSLVQVQKCGRVAQWITRLPTEQKIVGSNPAVVERFCHYSFIISSFRQHLFLFFDREDIYPWTINNDDEECHNFSFQLKLSLMFPLRIETNS